MKARETVLRLRRFDADEKRRKLADLEMMIRDFEQMAVDLDRQIQAEEDRTGIRDRNHHAYSTFAKSALQRRDNLKVSGDSLREKLEKARLELEEALVELTKVEQNDTHDQSRGQQALSRMARGSTPSRFSSNA
ncbi:MAG: flagellar export protein FliJ [Hyphomicrobiaceae bacterium]|nr:flagellar export protein FliJ [Hyphomicrobiaceae bacterium]